MQSCFSTRRVQQCKGAANMLTLCRLQIVTHSQQCPPVLPGSWKRLLFRPYRSLLYRHEFVSQNKTKFVWNEKFCWINPENKHVDIFVCLLSSSSTSSYLKRKRFSVRLAKLLKNFILKRLILKLKYAPADSAPIGGNLMKSWFGFNGVLVKF